MKTKNITIALWSLLVTLIILLATAFIPWPSLSAQIAPGSDTSGCFDCATSVSYGFPLPYRSLSVGGIAGSSRQFNWPFFAIDFVVIYLITFFIIKAIVARRGAGRDTNTGA